MSLYDDIWDASRKRGVSGLRDLFDSDQTPGVNIGSLDRFYIVNKIKEDCHCIIADIIGAYLGEYDNERYDHIISEYPAKIGEMLSISCKNAVLVKPSRLNAIAQTDDPEKFIVRIKSLQQSQPFTTDEYRDLAIIMAQMDSGRRSLLFDIWYKVDSKEMHTIAREIASFI